MSSSRWRAPAVLVVLLLGACADPPRPGEGGATTVSEGGVWFEEVAVASGVTFEHDSGHDGRFLMPEIMSGGVALVDLDGDEDLDLYFVQGGSLLAPPPERPSNRLYLNRGDGTFVDATAGSGADDRGYGMGVAAGDVDGDGDLDLYVTNVGPDRLLRNEGGGRFTDATAELGLGDPGWGASSAFFDFDRDGDLDLFVTRYLAWSPEAEIDCRADSGAPDYCSPQSYDAPVTDLLYRNDGSGGFVEVGRASGVGTESGTGLGAVVADFDGDRWPDVFVANDGMPDHLWRNQTDGTFVEAALLAGCAVDEDGQAKAGMGVAAADLDGDGDPDLLVCNLDRESDSLFLNEGGYFRDATASAGLGATSRRFTRFGVGLVDFDQDGWLDLYQANGRVTLPAGPVEGDPFAESNLLFRGTGAGRFEEVERRGGTRHTLVATSRAAAFGDLDGDGAVDVVVVNRDGPAHLLRNVAPDRGHWLTLDLRSASGAPAFGATARGLAGGRAWSRTVRSAASYQAASDPRISVGLGAATEASAVEVEWPGGAVQSIGTVEADRVAHLRRPGS